MQTIMVIHSLLIWLVLASGAGAAIAIAFPSLHYSFGTHINRIMILIFVASIDLQALLGLIVFLRNGASIRAFADTLPHAAVMFFVLISAHVASRWSKTNGRKYHTLVALAIAIGLVAQGI